MFEFQKYFITDTNIGAGVLGIGVTVLAGLLAMSILSALVRRLVGWKRGKGDREA